MTPHTDTHLTVDDLVAFRRSIEAEMALWIAAYRAAGHDPLSMLSSALEAFPDATGSKFAVALTRAHRARAG